MIKVCNFRSHTDDAVLNLFSHICYVLSRHFLTQQKKKSFHFAWCHITYGWLLFSCHRNDAPYLNLKLNFSVLKFFFFFLSTRGLSGSHYRQINYWKLWQCNISGVVNMLKKTNDNANLRQKRGSMSRHSLE